jgi:hypothetical protein
MDTEARGFPRGDIRVSDAERDQALAELSEHFQTGRLTQDEFDQRSGQALQARTGNDLAALFGDLPRRQAPVAPRAGGPWPASPFPPPPVAARPQGGWLLPTMRAVFVFAIVAVVAGTALGHGSHHGFGFLIPFVIVGMVVLRALRGRR